LSVQTYTFVNPLLNILRLLRQQLLIDLREYICSKFEPTLKYSIYLVAFLLFFYSASGQIVSTRSGHIFVQSSNNISNVKADNYQVSMKLDMVSGSVIIQGLLKSFEFQQGVVDQFFNTSTIDMASYSKFSYEGKIAEKDIAKLKVNGTHKVKVNGNIFIGNEKRNTPAEVTLIVTGESIEMYADMSFKIEEMNMLKINNLIKERLAGMGSKTFGISRSIILKSDAIFYTN
jgi:hypothetical protein